MTNAKKAAGLKKSKTAKKTQGAHTGWGWVTREYVSYAFVWFAGMAIGAWLF